MYTADEIKAMNMASLQTLAKSDLSAYSEQERQLIRREAYKKRCLYKAGNKNKWS